ncbi:substrate-binding periplasmic protein [Litorilituus lipolyticus]|uniref:Transporter substrate-binding domain-containing protein n=1 Tax=Litorilituus lipolyticus TaxID=2491017 RepID=A0A502L7W4_9GAMM|nr:transporter substrate-binding domain-containing protein [Litorilituus lipolyticus]TPH18555.1 transporter substrate-binding domain-containing protein [Litorilituus lipolyticus]
MALLFTSSVSACEFVMGYRTSERLPFIEKAPSNAGIYLDIYQLALKNIGCSLSVVRAPKKRILKMLALGEIDFYPGLGITKKRSEYLEFFDNGLTSHVIALSHSDTDTIHQFSDMSGKVLLTAIGANNFDARQTGILVREAYDLSLSTAVKLLSEKKVDFYLYNKDSVKYFLKAEPNDQIKLHPCCFNEVAMTLGFSKYSKFSKYYKYIQVTELPAKSPIHLNKAEEFKRELEKLKQLGVIAEIKSRYF